MARSSWNPNTPDVVGVEFLGIGVTNNVIQTGSQMRALAFTAQRSGEVDEVAIYSGALTNNPILSGTHFAGHRKPWLIELIPVSGFDYGAVHTITQYTSTITASSNVIDEVGTAPEGNELAVANDGLFLFQSGSTPASVTVHMPDASTFPTDRHVTGLGIEYGAFQSMNVRRIDQNGSYLWTRLLNNNGWHIGEAYIEAGTTTPWRLWSPTDVRQFASSVGNRRLRMDALNAKSNIMDLLRLHIDHVPERRAGVGIVEPPGNFQWASTAFWSPNVTGSPATIVQGGEYIILVRVPGSDEDYDSSGALDLRAVADRRPTGADFQHYTHLDWDLHDVVLYEEHTPQALGDMVSGLLSLRITNNSAQTVDTQPYQETIGVVPFKETDVRKCRQSLTVPAGTTEYARLRVNVAMTGSTVLVPVDKRSILVSVVNNADAVIAGPFNITEADWLASPSVGSDIFNDPYREVTVPFGSSIDINEAGGVNAKFTLHPDYGDPGAGNIVWRVGCLMADIAPVTGSDQTAAGAATGMGFIPPTNQFLAVNSSTRRADILVSLLSQAPDITGTGVTGLAQEVTGGVCDPCPPETPNACQVTEIPYHHVCWSQTSLPQEKFGYYEVQRFEHAVHGADWETIAILAPTGTPITGAPVTGVPTCFDDWSHVYDSEVCYRVRQQRVDGSLSDFVEEVCIMTPSPTGGDIVITAPEDPSFNVAFPEAHGAKLPIEHEWEVLDANQHVIRAIYGRDKHIAFRPLERLGVQFKRKLLISALCTPVVPCLSVSDMIHEVCQAPVSYLVVRDRCGNRWYSTISVPTITQLHDPDVGDFWLADIEVTELATPIITPESVGV